MKKKYLNMKFTIKEDLKIFRTVELFDIGQGKGEKGMSVVCLSDILKGSEKKEPKITSNAAREQDKSSKEKVCSSSTAKHHPLCGHAETPTITVIFRIINFLFRFFYYI